MILSLVYCHLTKLNGVKTIHFVHSHHYPISTFPQIYVNNPEKSKYNIWKIDGARLSQTQEPGWHGFGSDQDVSVLMPATGKKRESIQMNSKHSNYSLSLSNISKRKDKCQVFVLTYDPSRTEHCNKRQYEWEVRRGIA